jgi:predicted RND superfamily exporter protein
VLLVYFVLSIGSIYGATQLKVDFSIEFFVDEGSPIKLYLNANTDYFGTGSGFTIYTENKDLDYSSIQN